MKALLLLERPENLYGALRQNFNTEFFCMREDFAITDICPARSHIAFLLRPHSFSDDFESSLKSR